MVGSRTTIGLGMLDSTAPVTGFIATTFSVEKASPVEPEWAVILPSEMTPGSSAMVCSISCP